MAAPSKNWTNIADTQIDGSSPLDTILTTAIRDNEVNLKEWLGVSYTAAQNHDHDGVNSKSVILANAIVTVAKLKLLQGSHTDTVGGTFDITTLAQYSHLPSLRLTAGGAAPPSELTWSGAYISSTGGDTGYLFRLRCNHVVSGGSNAVVTWDYHSN